LRNRGRRLPGGAQVASRRGFGFVDAGITPHEQAQHYPYQSHEWTYYHRPYNYKHIPETAGRWGQIREVSYQSPYSNEFFSSIYKRHEETRQTETAPAEFLDEPLPLWPETLPDEYAPEDFAPEGSDPARLTPEEFAPPRPFPKERASFTQPNIRQVSQQVRQSNRTGSTGIGVWKTR
jgi:hypothetical protein